MSKLDARYPNYNRMKKETMVVATGESEGREKDSDGTVQQIDNIAYGANPATNLKEEAGKALCSFAELGTGPHA